MEYESKPMSIAEHKALNFPSVPTLMNPELTHEMEREVAFYLKWGYLVVDNALSMEQVEKLRSALDDVDLGEDRLLEQDDRFAFLVDNPPVLSRMKAILGNCLQLHSASARVTKPGAADMDWHRDYPWPVAPYGTLYGSVPGQINCGYYLDELTKENGPVVIVPGSHRAPFEPPIGHPIFPEEKHILAKPGQAILFDGATYHRAAANKSQGNRRVCFMCYQHAWMKSREPFNGPRVTKLREEGSAEVKLLLGEVKSW